MVSEALAIETVQKASADAIKLLNEANANEAVLKLKALEAFTAAADGQATKIIIPSEIQGLAGLAEGILEATKFLIYSLTCCTENTKIRILSLYELLNIVLHVFDIINEANSILYRRNIILSQDIISLNTETFRHVITYPRLSLYTRNKTNG